MTVQGVGAKAALAILGALGAEGVARALSLGDAAAIRAAPGVGPKIAQRVVLELKAKAPAVMAMGAPGRRRPWSRACSSRRPRRQRRRRPAAGGDAQAQADALSALVNLGYGQGEAAAAVAEASTAAPTPRRLIRAALRALAPKGLSAMADPDPALRPEPLPEDADRALRPQTLDEFVGQKAARANLAVFIESARRRGEAMDHTLFYGPPGLGKTTLAQIMARELGVNFRMTSGPVLAKAGDLAAILTNLDARDVLFIDEIHRLSPVVEEILYPALEDFQLDLVIGEGPAARTVRIELQPFTLVGATTRLGLLTTPLRDRFGIPTRLEFYDVDELVADRDPGGAADAGRGDAGRGARRSPGGRGARRASPGGCCGGWSDFAIVEGDGRVTREIADRALMRLGVDDLGLDGADRRYLRLLAESYGGGPVGVETIAAALSEVRDAIEEVIEPFLLQQGLIQRTPRGRMLAPRRPGPTSASPPPRPAGATGDLFEDG